MIESPLFQAVVFGTLIAFGVGLDRFYLTLRARKQKHIRRQSMGSYRRDPEPVWAKWAPEIGRAIGGRKDWR